MTEHTPDPLADLIAEHHWRDGWYRCGRTCEWMPDDGDILGQHAAHVAAVIRAAQDNDTAPSRTREQNAARLLRQLREAHEALDEARAALATRHTTPPTREVVEALALLVELKDGLRDEHYYATKEAAWDKARQALALYADPVNQQQTERPPTSDTTGAGSARAVVKPRQDVSADSEAAASGYPDAP